MKKKTSFISKYKYLQILFVTSTIILHISWKTRWFNLVANRMLSKQFRHPLDNAMVQVRNMGHLNWSRNFKSYKISSVDWISPVVWRHWFQLGVSPTILALNSVNEQPTVSVSVSLYFVAHYNVFFPLLHLLFRGACFSVACYCFFSLFPSLFPTSIPPRSGAFIVPAEAMTLRRRACNSSALS